MIDSDVNTSPLLIKAEDEISTAKTTASYSNSSSFIQEEDQDEVSSGEQLSTNSLDDTEDNGIGRWGAIAMVINL